MSFSTTYVERLERELLRAIGHRRRKRTVGTGLAAMFTVTTAVAGAVLLTGNGSSPALAIDIKDRLSERPDAVAFVVSSPTPSYWRLTALADFDGTRWTSRGETAGAGGSLPQDFGPGDVESLTQTFEITGLGGIWLPAAFMPVRVESPGGITIDAESSSLVTASEASDDLTYVVESVLPRYDVARLRAAAAPPTGGLAERYLELPTDFPVELADQARAIVAGASTRYDQAIALQNWFRGFTYDLSSRAGQSESGMREFLAARRGYCEQFAGTFAAFARVLGLPSRVAVGFTPGEQRDDGRYYVQGKHAHAWPEIYFDGIGWVPFEPTPGRGNPAAEQYTGVFAAQADSGGEATGP